MLAIHSKYVCKEWSIFSWVNRRCSNLTRGGGGAATHTWKSLTFHNIFIADALMKENPKKEFYRRAEYFLDTQYENILFGYENRIKRVRRVYFWRNFLKIFKNEDFGFETFDTVSIWVMGRKHRPWVRGLKNKKNRFVS